MSNAQHGSNNAESSGAPLLEDSFQEVDIHRSSEAAPLPAGSDHAPYTLQQDVSRNSALQSSIASDEKTQRRMSTKRHESWFSLWLWELFATAASVGCVIINLAILVSIDQKPLTSWTVADVDITPNALISIFATLSKSSMLYPVAEGISQLKWIFFQRNAYSLSYLETFDSASRGPLGALASLWRLRSQAVLASIGAVIVVLALAIDPFTQQILSYPVSNVNATNMTTSLHTTTHYNFYSESAILEGIFVPSALDAATCPTAKCRWPSFKSLGICSKCTDETASVAVSCATNGTRTPVCTVVAGKDTRYQTRFSWKYIHQGTTDWTVANVQGEPWWGNTVWFIAGPELPLVTLFGHGELVSFSFLQMKPEMDVSPMEHTPEINLTSCSLALCEKTYPQSHFEEGSLKTSAPISEPLSFSCPRLPLWDLEGHVNCTGVPVSQMPASGKLNTSTSNNPDLNVYWADNWSPFDTSLSMAAILMDSETKTPSKQRIMSYPIFSAFNRTFGQDLSLMMDSIATGITENMRKGPNSTEVSGEVIVPVVYVRVRWAWFAYPVVIILLAVVFWVTTVAFSCGESRLVWKSSSLALLFHGLRGWNVDEFQTDRLRDMNDAASDMRAHLTRDDGGRIKFVRS